MLFASLEVRKVPKAVRSAAQAASANQIRTDVSRAQELYGKPRMFYHSVSEANCARVSKCSNTADLTSMMAQVQLSI